MFETRYWLWQGVLSDELCDAIILEGDKLISGDGRTGGIDEHGPGGYNPNIRETNISFFDQYHWIHGICLHYANAANVNAKWNFDIRYAQNVQYARYFPDQHYSIHEDDTVRPHREEMRKLSVAIQVSSPQNYEGGQFSIQSQCGKEMQQVNEFTRRGSVIVFPSVMKHGIMPVTYGVRHSIVCWIVGPNFR